MDLPPTGLAHQAHGLTRTNVKVDMVDDVDITVMLKLDAEVTDRENRLNGLVGHVAIVTLELDIAQGARRAERDWACVLVGANGVGDQRVGLARRLEGNR